MGRGARLEEPGPSRKKEFLVAFGVWIITVMILLVLWARKIL